MPLKRVARWDTQVLHDFLQARAKMPFAWGKNDCCLFPADAIEAYTGTDLAAAFRGKYSDEVSAFASIASVSSGKTVGDAAAWCAAQHGLVERQFPRMAQRGDLVTFMSGAQEIAGIVGLNGQLVSVGPDGLIRMQISLVKRAWAV